MNFKFLLVVSFPFFLSQVVYQIPSEYFIVEWAWRWITGPWCSHWWGAGCTVEICAWHTTFGNYDDKNFLVVHNWFECGNYLLILLKILNFWHRLEKNLLSLVENFVPWRGSLCQLTNLLGLLMKSCSCTRNIMQPKCSKVPYFSVTSSVITCININEVFFFLFKLVLLLLFIFINLGLGKIEITRFMVCFFM